MSEPAPARMTADAFLDWAMRQPEGQRYELVAGEVISMAPERATHARLKGRIFRRLCEALEATGVRCEAYPDGMAVRVDDGTIYEPDAMVRRGEPLQVAGTITTRILREGPVQLDPPGIMLAGIFDA